VEAVGAVGRFTISTLLQKGYRHKFSIWNFECNILGSLLSVSISIFETKYISNIQSFINYWYDGSLTTFSTFSLGNFTDVARMVSFLKLY